MRETETSLPNDFNLFYCCLQANFLFSISSVISKRPPRFYSMTSSDLYLYVKGTHRHREPVFPHCIFR